MTAYLKNPTEIYDLSFATIRQEADLSSLPQSAHALAIRLIHASGMVEIIDDLRFSANFIDEAGAAIKRNAPILVDAEMVRYGIIHPPSLPVCFLNDPMVPELAQTLGTTRSAAAVTLWPPVLEGALVVIGNAPTALFQLLEGIDAGWPRPAAIIGFPVGFVGAAESKLLLTAHAGAIPYATILGRRGGSALAAAAVNAIIRGLAS